MSKTEYGYFGTWCRQESDAKVTVWNIDTGDLVQSISMGNADISYVTIHPEGHLLYVLQDEDPTCKIIGGRLLVFRIGEEGSLSLLEIYSTVGAHPIDLLYTKAHVAVLNHGSTTNSIVVTERDIHGNWIVKRQYDEASIVIMEHDDSGLPGKITDIYRFWRSGSVPFFQESAAPHSLSVFEKENVIAVPERGSDQISLLKLCEDTGRVKLCENILVPRGKGPRNAVFHPNGSWLYVVCEIEPDIYVFRKNAERGFFEKTGVVCTVPADVREANPHPATSFEALHPVAISVSGNGSFLLALTRSSNSLTVYRIQEDTGELSLIQTVTLKGDNPREMHFSEDESRIDVIMIHSGTVERYAFDQHTGQIQFMQNVVYGCVGIATGRTRVIP